MTANTNDGGPAFPNDASASLNAKGMTLRDWFAGQALSGMLTNGFMPDSGVGAVTRHNMDYILAAYEIADAMLAARTPATER